MNKGYRRQYYIENRSRLLAQMKAHYEKNKQAILAKQKIRSLDPVVIQHRRRWLAQYRMRPEVKRRRIEEARNRYKNNPGYFREAFLKQRYGMTVREYDDLLASQHGVCAICGRTTGRKTKWKNTTHLLVVDHCHTHKKVRGLLCHDCNSGLGSFRDNTSYLLRAIEYLDRFHKLLN